MTCLTIDLLTVGPTSRLEIKETHPVTHLRRTMVDISDHDRMGLRRMCFYRLVEFIPLTEAVLTQHNTEKLLRSFRMGAKVSTGKLTYCSALGSKRI